MSQIEPEIQQITPEAFAASASGGPAAEVRRIAEACDEADGVITLNEQACLQLKYRGLRDASLWLGAGGFALLHGQILDLAVHPDSRGQGVGTALARLALAATDKVEAWSHSDHPAAAKIADRLGIPKERELRIMSRPTSLPVADAVVPPGVRIRTFLPSDEQALLEVNAAAFAHHPEQGHMTHEDFQERTSEAWFDAGGLFLAVPEDDDPEMPLLGFHWTKVHPPGDADPEAIGEIYVLGVDPDAQGLRLGRALTDLGLAHLRRQGLGEVLLYTEEDNVAAVALYERTGFRRFSVDVSWRRNGSGS